ncbi:zinc-dependent metalloprotease [Bacillus sonorensis]|uniref:Peptidase M84 n=2 Tax=Bacillus sonorensis TaxID=119858 RepID=M5PE29_9BACI|nr:MULTISPECIES: zinc-dependent metalloprotease [Bacillus]TWK78900.1 hypothetical protein CHCC20335_1838 [Bacillus paralicheniformis]ASB87997.1 hypothetical protein S101395_01487 [Bacillus sonorensis]EME75240.1 hypothetical protein BSONL12_09642 [Bacillus sonorensis L12]MBG9915885.1 peptidase M84 [Bacillus sonorensis]MCF7617329.1 zinc-dependent metalloprotease [Bacillus sonorensis]
MKKRSLFFTLLLSASLIPGAAGVAETGGHGHPHEAKGIHIEALPKPKDGFKDLAGKVHVEKTTKTKVLDEKGNTAGTMTFEKNVNNSKFSTQASTGKQKVSVLAVADKQFRTKYKDWKTRIVQIVEEADEMFNRDHDIDFVVEAVAPWNSSGKNASDILDNLAAKFEGQPYKFVAGFTANDNFEAGGIAFQYPVKPDGPAFSVTLDMGTENSAKAARHEFSHNFGVEHDPQGSGIRCIMNYDYAYTVDVWDEAHNELIEKNKVWYQ